MMRTKLLEQAFSHNPAETLPTIISCDSFTRDVLPSKGILDPDYVVNVSFRQLLLKCSDYSAKLKLFDRKSRNEGSDGIG